MYIDIVPTRKSPPAVLLRQSRREGGKIVKTTLANLSTCPPEAVEALRVALVPNEEVFAVERSLPHGHVQAVLGVMAHRGHGRAAGRAALSRAGPGAGNDRAAAVGPRVRSWPPRGCGTRRRWRRSWGSTTRTRMPCRPPWIGSISARAASRRRWRRGTSPTARWCSSMSRVRPSMAGRALSPDVATTATGRRYRALSTAC